MSSDLQVQEPKVANESDKQARIQVTEEELDQAEPDAPAGTTYNVWFRRFAGGDKNSALNRRQSPFRCNPTEDSGFTKGDTKKGAPLCLFFARGMCTKGQSCKYLHRLPANVDLKSIKGMPISDCFGRERHAEYRDDMVGIGSYKRRNRTLFVTGLKPRKDLQSQLTKQFGDWGEVVSVVVLREKHSAFVEYKDEAAAQFAKEAMANQSLGGKTEVLTIKWATQSKNTEDQSEEEAEGQQQASSKLEEAPVAVLETGILSNALVNKLKRTRDFVDGANKPKRLVNYPDSD